MPSKQELLEENDALIELIEEIQDRVTLPEDLQDTIDDLLGTDEDADDDAIEVEATNGRNGR